MASRDESGRRYSADDVLNGMAEYTAAILHEQYGLPEKRAREAAESVAGAIRSAFAGSICYFPMPSKTLNRSRDNAIYDRFNGVNHVALCKEYGLTRRRLYQIITEVRERRIVARRRR